MSANVQDHDPNMIEGWTSAKPKRWLAGIISGLIAGVVAQVVGAIIVSIGGHDSLMLIQLEAIPFMGGEALNIGNTSAVILGFVFWEAVCGFFGFVFSHFTLTNAFMPLLGVGVAWGAFAWVFLNNLFSPAWREVHVADVSQGTMFAVWMTYGACLTLVGVFSKIFGHQD